jgi:ParB/RepB/Spo0J family partition protein
MADATNGQKTDRVAIIPLSSIKENQVGLRPVDRESEEYLSLVDSVKEKGIMNPISVRELPGKDEKTGESTYGLIDGLHRFYAANDAGLKEIPVLVKSMEQAEVEEAQIVANIHKIETTPIQYTKQLVRLMERNPMLTEPQLAKKLSMSTTWLSQRFGLMKLDEKLQPLVDDGTIKLNNAYMLAKLPKEEQAHFADSAMTMEPGEFIPTVTARLKELKEARRQGKLANPPQFQPVVHQRKWSEIRDEYNNPTVVPMLIQNQGIKDPVEAAKMALAWVCNMDPVSKQVQVEKNAAKMREADEKKKKREAERAQKRASEAQEKLAELGVGAPA